jgi:hypothetical protein
MTVKTLVGPLPAASVVVAGAETLIGDLRYESVGSGIR